MDNPRPARPPLPTWLLAVLLFVIALALTILTVYYQHPDGTLCRGLLGAGFPLPFICDASGESPLSSVGRIDWADLNSIKFLGTLIDLLFYSLILWGGWALWQRLTARSPRRGR